MPRVGYPDPETFRVGYAAAAEWLDALPFPAERIVLGGFSQGAVMTYALGLGKGRPRPAALIALSGFIPTVDGWEPDLEPPFPPIAIVHGDVRPGDPGRVRARARATLLEEAGAAAALPRGAGRPHDRPVGAPRAPAGGGRTFIRSRLLAPRHFKEEHMRKLDRPVGRALAVAALAVAGSAGASRHAGTFTYCTDPTFPPMELATASGKITGFDVDMAQRARADVGRERRRP